MATNKNTHDFVYECRHCKRSPWEFRKQVRILLRAWAVKGTYIITCLGSKKS
jgi:hypothetical protein